MKWWLVKLIGTMSILGVLAAVAGLTGCGGEPRRAAVRELSVPSVSEPSDTAQVTDPARALQPAAGP